MKNFAVIVFAVCIVVGLAFANFFSAGRLTGDLFNVKWNIGSHTLGSGNVVSEKRDVSGFTAVDVSGAFQVEISAGKEYSVEVQADDNIVPVIVTRVSGSTLVIELDERVSTKSDMIVRIAAPNIERIETSGASKVNAVGIRNDTFAIEMTGASKAVLSGEVKKLDIDLSGASIVDAEQLVADVVNIDSSGASKIAVNARVELHTHASGASRITYTGEPTTLDNRASGASSIIKK